LLPRTSDATKASGGRAGRRQTRQQTLPWLLRHHRRSDDIVRSQDQKSGRQTEI
jgi:hypothetical protein